jgi:uncharacterized protein with HEPN domain
MSRHDDAVFLRHMLDYASEAIDLAAGKKREALDTDKALRYALLHLVTVLGEAATRLSPAGRAQYSQIPWRKIVGTRHRLIHGYDAVDFDILWKTVEVDLPVLIQALRSSFGEDDGP